VVFQYLQLVWFLKKRTVLENDNIYNATKMITKIWVSYGKSLCDKTQSVKGYLYDFVGDK